MALRSVFVCLFVGLTLCGLSPVYAQGPGNGQGNGGGNAPIEQPVPVPETLTVDVNCADGDTISQALERPAVELTILVSGTCTENVFITRDNVILRGTTLDEGDPTAAIVAASTDLEAPSFGVVVYVAGAQTVRIEDLKIRGGRWGIAVTGFGVGSGVGILNCRILDNLRNGLLVFRGRGNATDTHFSSNGSQVGSVLLGGAASVIRYSSFTFNNCVMDATVPPVPGGVFDLVSALNVDTYSTVLFRNRNDEEGLLKGRTSLNANTNSTVTLRGDRQSGVFKSLLFIEGVLAV